MGCLHDEGVHFGRHDFRSFQLQLHAVWFWKDEKDEEEKVGDGDPGEVDFESIYSFNCSS